MRRPMTPPTASLPKQANAFSKLRLLLWKNYLLQKRHKFQTLVDIFLPVVFFVFCAWLQRSVGTVPNKQQIYEQLPINSLQPLFDHNGTWFPPINKRQLVFAPNNAIFKNLMDDVAKMLDVESIGAPDNDQLQTLVVDNGLIAGILFHHSNNISELPKNLAYSLRFPAELRTTFIPSYSRPEDYNWQTNLLFPNDGYTNRYPDEDDGGPPSYQREGFLPIQNAIATAFVNMKAQKKIPDIKMQRFPIPSHLLNIFATDLQFVMPLFFLMCLNYTFMNTVRFISIEKEKQLKEAMKIMGLASWMHYFSWFIRTIVMLSIAMILITVLLTSPWFGATTAIFPNSRYLCLLIFFIGYCICLITFGFVICAFFTRSKAAMTGSTIIWYVTSAPFFFTFGRYDNLPGWLKLLLCFCPNTAMAYGFKIIARLEDIGIGLNWHSAFQNVSVYDNLTVARIFGIFIVNACILFAITLYVENILPGVYGVAKPWYFVFTKDFWQGLKNYQQFDNHRTISEHSNLAQSSLDQSNFESEPMNRQIGIEIHNLTKKFTNDKAAVNQLCLNIYDNQITTLLGQNGAGKTTTISMLTGMIEPTSGSALINGYDIRKYMDFARSSMGFCPQHNILFDELTVREHILFYCSLKGLTADAAENEARKYERLLDLEGKENAMSSTLSGGMKRKLSVVIALCGQSKVVFLDEPTSGMDPGARRALWDILLAEKKDRTILLTTHFMDEADVLSDRIAILADGELRCAGSTFFLKKRFGTGYHLICAKNRDCDSHRVTELLQKYIPEVRVESENDTELAYVLPEDRNEQFTTIFKDLENNEARLNLTGFGVSLTTLEEIFLKFGKSEKCVPSTPNDRQQANDISSEISDTRITLNDNHYLVRGTDLLMNQTRAMLKKRYLCWIRALPSFCYYNCFVIVMMSMIIFNIGELFSRSSGLPSLDINLDQYRSPLVVLQRDSSSSFSNQYERLINQSSAQLYIANGNIQTSLLAIAQSMPREYNFQYLTGASAYSDGSIIAWFNNQAIHSATLALDLVHNALIKLFLGEDHSIKVTNAPLKFLPSNDTTSPDLDNVDTFGFSFSIVFGTIMAVLSASYISFYIKEKECNARFLQYTSGVSLPIFWGASIIWDLLTNSITIFIIIFMLILGQHDYWKSPSELGIVFLIVFMYNFAMMPVICILSLIFTKPSLGMNVITISNFVIMTVYLINSVVHFMNNIISNIFWAYPLCTVIDGLLKLPTLHSNELTCQAECDILKCDWAELCKAEPKCCPGNIFSWKEGIGKNLVLMLFTGAFAFAVLIAIEFGGLRFVKQFIFRNMKRVYPSKENESEDDDVAAEKVRINNMSQQELQSETLVMQNVSKFYGNFCAVNKISVAIKRGECFGLLGKNGAGKSSIFKMLTGETMITEGEIFTQGYNQKYQLHDIYQVIGYCPQFDALLSGLTCRETLEMFAMLRGIPAKDVKSYIENCARNLDFIQHIDKKVQQLSGGNKRKLSTSLAMIGNLNVIFLDEPTTGLDPATKRNLWNVVIQSRDGGKSIVLTSHSMEECEALCTRITVFVNGKSKCLGSSQHLKNKFCKGFELKIKVKQDDDYNLNQIETKNFVLQTFNGSIFREEYQGILTYSVPADNIKWSSVFAIMENAKKLLKIEDYAISQNSLEQVVLMFVKDQRDQHNPQNEHGAN